MNKLFLVIAVVLAFTACNAPNADDATTSEQVQVENVEGTAYKVDSSSKVTWIGTKPTGKHEGTFAVKEGNLLVNESALVGGSFTIDIASISNTDLAGDPDNKAKLEGHLKSPDFFNVEKYPTAKFEISSVEPFIADSTSKDLVMKDATHTIKGNLTLKDVTKSVSFPAKVTIDAASAVASADFNIDRTVWEMNYKGPNNPADWVISKTVNIKLDIKASKK